MERRRLFGILTGVCLIVTSLAYVGYHAGKQKAQQDWADAQVEIFTGAASNQCGSHGHGCLEGTSHGSEAQDDKDGSEGEGGRPSDIKEDSRTVAVMTLPTLDRSFPLAEGSVEDVEEVERLLKRYAVIYREYGGIGKVHHNAVISAHSSINDVGCGHCYFDGIEALKAGETIEIINSEGRTLEYEIILVSSHNEPYESWFYDQPVDIDESWITLITCTDGNSQFRTIVRARLAH